MHHARADHLRTVQQFMKVRRATMAHEVLLGPLPRSADSVLDVVTAEGRVAIGGDTEKLGSITS